MNIWETIGDFMLDNWEKIGILLAIIFKKNESEEEKTAKKIAKLKKKEKKQAKSLQKTLKKQAEFEEKGGQ